MMAFCNYRSTATALEAVFPAENLLFLFYEDLFSETTLKQLCAFADAGYQPPAIVKPVNETPLKVDLPDEARDRLRTLLEPQYAFCRKHFVGRVPGAWLA